jgi:hypothetical protein
MTREVEATTRSLNVGQQTVSISEEQRSQLCHLKAWTQKQNPDIAKDLIYFILFSLLDKSVYMNWLHQFNFTCIHQTLTISEFLWINYKYKGLIYSNPNYPYSNILHYGDNTKLKI